MSLIIPGVQVSVIRELVPRPLGATGILGIVGPTGRDMSNKPLAAMGSLQEFRDTYGAVSVLSLPEVRQAFANGLRQVVVANTPPDTGSSARTTVVVQVGAEQRELTVRAKAPGRWGNALAVRVVARTVTGRPDPLVDVTLFLKENGKLRQAEAHRNLESIKESEQFFIDAVRRQSELVDLELTQPLGPKEKVLPLQTNPDALPTPLTSGDDPLPADYSAALARLETYADIDMVTASHQMPDEADATAVWSAVRGHCDRMSSLARNRVGFGQILSFASRPQPDDLAAASRIAGSVVSDRFVMVAPNGYLGAVIGMIAALEYYMSPTHKPLAEVASLGFDFADAQLESLLKAGCMPVDMVPRKGVAVVHGLTTDRGQLNVTRVADRAVRHVQNIAQDYIGLLNTEEQRMALRQRISEAFARMEAESAIVPSTDGKSPAYQVDVRSSQDDFAAGIVRVHIAIRPVRAIDYIYATIKVQAF